MNIDTIREALDALDIYIEGVIAHKAGFSGVDEGKRHAKYQLQKIAIAALSAIDPEAETGWMIEKHNPMPMWWNGCPKREGNGAWSSDPNDGIRFSRKLDAELCSIAQGFSLSKVQITDHRWG